MNPFPEFSTFFREVWGYDPFPWQRRLAGQIAAGLWPEWITLPTGTGKTTALDIAIYNLACQAARSPGDRTAPVRIVFAVNRRIVVDEAYERAKTIANRLKEALINPTDILQPVALALQALSGIKDGPPLETYPLRGATFTDHSWARTPTQALVISTTLDQLGSRLLFRGYGVSQYARPIHAALLANDALLILDEAHTAKAFSQTLKAVAQFRLQARVPMPLPFAAVQLTATPPVGARDLFALDQDDRDHPIIKARLGASKPAELRLVSGASGKTARHKRMAEEMAERAIALLAEGHPRILIVVNRVATAEALKAKLDPEKGAKGHEADVHILTGRLRPLDRESLIQQLAGKYQLKSSSPPADFSRLILIATQCIEVGADYDFDALLTELAPLDNLRQRFGRLNRQGRDIPAPATIFAPEEALDDSKPDPLYGTCLPAIWAWLPISKNAENKVDFGVDSIQSIISRTVDLSRLLAPAPDAPLLLEPHLDLFCQTSPEPHVSPEPSLYIHGPGRSFPEVSVVLRADLAEGNTPLEMLKAAPPIGTEAATVPLRLAREWLENPDKATDGGGDAPDALDAAWSRGKVNVPNAYRWNSDDACPLVASPSELRPGDILVVPAQTPQAWLKKLFPVPSEASPWALDQYERAGLLSRDRLTIRFHAAVRNELEACLTEEGARVRFREITSPLFARDEEENRWIFRESVWTKAIPGLAAFLAEHLSANHPLKALWNHAAFIKPGTLRPETDWKAVPYPDETIEGVVFTNRNRIGATPWPFDPEDLGRQGNGSAESISLAEHTDAVSKRAESNACGLSADLMHTLRDAGAWHDLGKLDPRFQAMLHGCSLWAVETKTNLAKSGRRSTAMEKFFRRLSGLPDGFRHELLSALIINQSEIGKQYPERELLLHLIASHHGRCRSMAPVIHDPTPEPFDVPVGGEALRFAGQDHPLAHLSEGVARRFWNLNRRFGWWGLPYLEAMLRLADQYESANTNSTQSS
jgi:CRISPR-associated endonuclease/helicase Cas3